MGRLIAKGFNTILDLKKADPGSPITADTIDLLAKGGKAIIGLAKEVLF